MVTLYVVNKSLIIEMTLTAVGEAANSSKLKYMKGTPFNAKLRIIATFNVKFRLKLVQDWTIKKMNRS